MEKEIFQATFVVAGKIKMKVKYHENRFND